MGWGQNLHLIIKKNNNNNNNNKQKKKNCEDFACEENTTATLGNSIIFNTYKNFNATLSSFSLSL